MLKNSDLRAQIDNRNEKTGRKIRDAELMKIPYMIIVGEKEEAENTVSVRKQGHGDLGTFTTEELVTMITEEVNKSLS